jgi:hypothetical protein
VSIVVVVERVQLDEEDINGTELAYNATAGFNVPGLVYGEYYTGSLVLDSVQSTLSDISDSDDRNATAGGKASDGSSTDEDGTTIAIAVVVSIIILLVLAVIAYFAYKACLRKDDTKTLMDKINQ